MAKFTLVNSRSRSASAIGTSRAASSTTTSSTTALLAAQVAHRRGRRRFADASGRRVPRLAQHRLHVRDFWLRSGRLASASEPSAVKTSVSVLKRPTSAIRRLAHAGLACDQLAERDDATRPAMWGHRDGDVATARRPRPALCGPRRCDAFFVSVPTSSSTCSCSRGCCASCSGCRTSWCSADPAGARAVMFLNTIYYACSPPGWRKGTGRPTSARSLRGQRAAYVRPSPS